MIRPRRRNPVLVALYVNAGALVLIAAALLTRDAAAPSWLPSAMGQAQPAGIAGGAGLFVMPAQFSSTVWGCYLLDVDQQTLCAYTVSGSPPKLRLVAARDVRHDRRLKNWNTLDPSPQEVADLVAKEAASSRVVDPPAPQPTSPEQPKQD